LNVNSTDSFPSDSARPELNAAMIAVIDVETTGIFPLRNDRVLEVAAVVIQPDGRVEREFVSLVNPGRDIGPSHVHGLLSEDILPAPRFSDVAPLLVDVLDGTVAIAGHNVRFDRQFLDFEFSRIGQPMPDCFSMCTMLLAGGGTLAGCCENFGVSFEAAHEALADARAAARLLTTLLADDPDLTYKVRTLTPIQWPALQRTDKQAVTRDESRRRKAEPPTFLRRLLARMDHSSSAMSDNGAVMEYWALLDRVLEDRVVEDSEADALFETAASWGLSGHQIRVIHGDYLNQVARAALADGIVTQQERRDLELVARLLLGGERLDLEQILQETAATLPNSPPIADDLLDLTGKRVCFTGNMQCSRERAEELASMAGLEVVNSVTKKLDLLVVADPHTQSGKAKKAREYGVRIMCETVFWDTLRLDVS
jgi:DNA polymerase III subunit epsilon